MRPQNASHADDFIENEGLVEENELYYKQGNEIVLHEDK